MEIKKKYYSDARIVENYENFRFGGKYGKIISDREIEVIISMMAEDLKTANKILDIPCGTGRLIEKYDNLISKKTFGCDYSPAMLAYTKKKLTGKFIKFSRCDVFNMPFKKNEFDIITSIRFLSHYKETKQILDSLNNLLKPGGILIFDTYLWSPRSFFSFKLGGSVFTHTPAQVKKMIASINGLEIIEFKSNFIISPLFYRYFPGTLVKFLFMLEKFIPEKMFVRQYWKIRKKK